MSATLESTLEPCMKRLDGDCLTSGVIIASVVKFQVMTTKP